VKGTAVLAVETTLATADPTGAVLGGHLVVRGAFLDVEVVETDNGPAMRRNGVDINFTLDQQPSPSYLGARSPRVICWFVCFIDVNDGYRRCSWLNILHIVKDHPRQICERIGYKDLWCWKTDRQMAFFEDYETYIGVVALV
jgi:hypothetical protein